MVHFCLIGAGRIGAIHGANAAAHPKARLRYVVDVDQTAARKLAADLGAEVCDVETALADEQVDAVMICSSTNTHVDYLLKAAQAGKAIFCEKPIDLDIARVDDCLQQLERAGVPCMIAFNRRFDPSFGALQERLRAGVVGELEQVCITSRDPGPPPAEYVKVSGGLFRDMMIHDLDMARWLLGEEPLEVFASASCLVEPAIGKVGDVDSAMVVLKTASGRLCQISNSRRATYGYDQRIEVLGSKGMLQAANVPETTVSQWDGEGVNGAKPLFFFLERYLPAYRVELDRFITDLTDGRAMSPSPRDGRQALVLADAATRSAQTGQLVKLQSL